MNPESVVRFGKGLLLGLIYISLALLCFNIFIPISDPILTYDAKRFFSLSLVSLFSLLTIISSDIREFIVSRIVSLSYATKLISASLFTIVFISDLFNSSSFISSYIYDFYLLGIVLLSFLFLGYYKKDKGSYFFLCTILTICLSLSVIVAFYFRVVQGLDANYRTILSFVNPRFMNQVHVWLILPVFYLFITAKLRRKPNFLYQVLLIVSLSMVFTLDARGLFFSIIGGLLLILILEKKHRLLWGKSFVVSIISGGVLSLVLFKYLPMIILGEFYTLPEVRTSSSGRFELWQDTLLSSQWFGHGGGSYVCDGFAFGHPHNSLLSIGYHWGAMPAVLYSALCLMLLYRVIHATSSLNRILGINVLVGLAYSLLSGVLTMSLSQVMTVISLSVFWASCHKPASVSIPTRANHFFLILIALVILFSCAYFIYMRFAFYTNIDVYQLFYAEKALAEMWLGGNCFK